MYQRKNEKTNEKYVEMNENETTTYQSMMDVAKAVLRGTFIAINAYIRKKCRDIKYSCYMTFNFTSFVPFSFL